MIKREILLFVFIGILTVIIDFVSYRFLFFYINLSLDLAKSAAFIIGSFFAYSANRLITFKRKRYSRYSILRFSFLYFVTMSINAKVNFISNNIFAQFIFSFELAFIIATATSAALNFFGMKYFVFQERV